VSSDDPIPEDETATAVPDPRDRRVGQRRGGSERRDRALSPPGAERRGVERRSSDRRADPVVPDLYRAGARHMNEYPLAQDEMEFINAINAYRQRHSRPFPTWSEVLHVVKALGYARPHDSAQNPSAPPAG
jgi:hypothetical protein